VNRTGTVAVDAVVNGLVFYAVGRALRGHRAGLRLGVAGGVLAALAALSVGSGVEPGRREPDGPTASAPDGSS
jgi:hypothetical protein